MSENKTAEVFHRFFSCRSLQELLDTARSVLKSPLVLADLTFHVLAITQEPGLDDPRWVQIAHDRFIPLDIVNLELYQSSRRNQGPVLSTDHTGLTIVRSAIADDGKLIGYLLCPGHGGIPDEADLDVIRALSDFCCLKMQKELHYAEYPENMLEFFISDLLGGVITDEQKILDRCRYFHWTVKTPYRVLSIQPVSISGDGEDYMVLGRMKDALSAQFPDATTFLFGNQIKLVVHVFDQTAQDALILSEIQDFLCANSLRAGVSQVAYHVRSLSTRHQQSSKALELGILLKGCETMFYYDKYAIYHLLELCAPQINLLQCCHSAVSKLESYDRKNGTELLETLHAYLTNNKSNGDAAASLFIHRNTLTKRLEKISDLIHLDLNDSETTFHLQFSYRILEYYGATQMQDAYENWLEKSPTLRHP